MATSAEQAFAAQSAAAYLARLLEHLVGVDEDEQVGVSVGDGKVMLTAEAARYIADVAASVLPHCYSSSEGFLVPGCAMPEAICHPCAQEGRRLPPTEG